MLLHEALRLSCCEDEASTELLGLITIQKLIYLKATFVSAITFEMYDGTFVPCII